MWGAFVTALFLFAEDRAFQVGAWKWLIVAGILLLVIAFRRRREIFDTLYPPFDMEIADAVYHLTSRPHTFENEIKAERSACEQIHREIKSGRVAVIGRYGPGGPYKRISRRTCRKFRLSDMVTYSKEVQFGLIPATCKQDRKPYMNLIVSSREIYRCWPRTKETRPPDKAERGEGVK